MNVKISLVSHGHFHLIDELGGVEILSKEKWIEICIVDNIGEHGFEQWCYERGINYLKNDTCLGFGENNNKAFNHFYERNFEEANNWFFLVLNPDVLITVEQLKLLIETVHSNGIRFSCINLFKDTNNKIYDNSVRNYPSLLDFISSFILSQNKTILDKSLIERPLYVDWASGSFLLFDAKLYKALNGFDENYFMYCEDVDICLRANMIHDCKLTYLPHIQALHLAAHKNRKIFSKHFVWHIKSMCRYLMVKNRILISKYLNHLFYSQ